MLLSGERLCRGMKKERFTEAAILWSIFFHLLFCIRAKALLSKLVVLPINVQSVHENKISFRKGLYTCFFSKN